MSSSIRLTLTALTGLAWMWAAPSFRRLVNLKGEILAQREERTDVRGGDHVFDQIARLAYALVDGSASRLKAQSSDFLAPSIQRLGRSLSRPISRA